MVVTEFIFHEQYTDEVASDSGFVIETKGFGAKSFFLKFEISVAKRELRQKLLQLISTVFFSIQKLQLY